MQYDTKLQLKLTYSCRKQELRELKVLQKQEQKQFQDLTMKIQSAKDLQVSRQR